MVKSVHERLAWAQRIRGKVSAHDYVTIEPFTTMVHNLAYTRDIAVSRSLQIML